MGNRVGALSAREMEAHRTRQKEFASKRHTVAEEILALSKPAQSAEARYVGLSAHGATEAARRFKLAEKKRELANIDAELANLEEILTAN